MLDGRIVGGIDTTIDSIPYQISMLNFGSHRCGGSILNDWTILTAAHCLRGTLYSNVGVRFGSTFRNRGGSVFPARDQIEHPKYDPATLDSDIGVIFLEFPIKFGIGVGRVELARTENEVMEGEISRISGWGATTEGGFAADVLQVVEIPVVSREQCRIQYGEESITDNMMCAGLIGEGGVDSCQGDSGGPLLVRGIQFGIVSWGFGCARPESPGVYSYVPALYDWVQAVIV